MKKSFWRRPGTLAAGLVLLAVGILLGRLLVDPSQVLLYRDAGSMTISSRGITAQSLLRFGELPFWNPYTLGGAPFLADPSNAVYFPLNAIFLFFPANLPYGQSWFLAIQFVLAFWGFFRWGKGTGLSPWGAGITSTLATFSGLLVSCLYLAGTLGAWMGIGWLFWAWERFQKKRKPFYLFLSSFCLAMPALSGDPQVAYLVALFFLPLHNWQSHGRSPRAWVNLVFLYCLGALVTAPQTLPTLGLLPETLRSVQEEMVGRSETWSLHPFRLFEWIFPLPFGASIYQESHLMRYLNGPDPIPFVFSIYSSCLFLPLLGAGLNRARDHRAFAWLGLGLFLAYLSLGSYAPFSINYWMSLYFPGWGLFRYPERLQLFALLAFLFSFARVYRQQTQLPKDLWVWCAGVAGFSLLAAVFGIPDTLGRAGAWWAFLLTSVASMVLFFVDKKSSSFPALPWSLAFLVTLDLALALKPIVWNVPAEVTRPDWPPFVRLLGKERPPPALEDIPRFYNLDEGTVQIQNLDRLLPGLSMPRRLSVYQYIGLTVNTGVQFGLGNPLGEVTFMPKRQKELWNAVIEDPVRAFSVKGTNYFGRVSGEGQYSLRANSRALPLFWLPAETEFLADGPQTLARARSPDWAWDRRLLLTGEGSASKQNGTLSARVLRRSFRSLDVELDWEGITGEAWLLWNESYDKHWRASWENGEIKILPANHWASGLRLHFPEPKGKEVLHLEFRDPLVPAGQGIFGLWLLLFAGAVIGNRYFPTKSKQW